MTNPFQTVFELHALRGTVCSGPMPDPNAGCACGSMGRNRSCSETICTLCKWFLNKHEIFRPAGGDIRCHVSDRVPRVNNTRYAVAIQTGRLTR